MGDPSPITEQELTCFFSNRRIQPLEMELDLLLVLDQAALSATDDDTESE